ncbi:MAG: DUF58 domain-containing protein [Planctomycetaceae bacterium]
MALPTDPADLAKFGNLELVARQLVEGLMMGRHRSPFKGASVEFVEHREYSPGDEIRHIDWRAYGKTGRYHVKEFEDETNLRCHLLVDASGSMAYAGASVSKFRYAALLASSLAWLLLRQRDSVGLLTFDAAIRDQLRPSSSRDMFQRITRVLEQTRPGTETGLAAVIESVLPSIARRSLLILISDCFDSPDALERSLQRCRHAGHEVIVFRIAAAEETTFDFQRPTQFRDMEDSDHRMLVDPVRLRHDYLSQYNQFFQKLENVCTGSGIDYRTLLTSDPLQDSLGHWLAERQSRRTGFR